MKIREVAGAQRLLLWSIVGWIIFSLVLVAIPLQIYSVFQLAKAVSLSASSSILNAIAMFIPLVSLLCLLAFNGKATVYLQSNGIPVRLVGVKRADLPPAV